MTPDAQQSQHDLREVINQVKLHFIEPGKSTQNGKIESFNGRLRGEFLN